MTAIYRKELRGYFMSPTGYVVMAVFFAVIGLCTRLINLKSGGYPQFEYALAGSPASLVYVLILPVLAMRSFAEERRQKTDQLLYALPIRSADVVIGKYLAMLTVLAIPTVCFCLYPPILRIYGNVNYAGAYNGILLYFLLGAALLAMCMFFSALTESQLIAAVLGVAVLFAIFSLPTLVTLIPSTALSSVVGYLVLIAVFSLLLYRLTSNATLSVIAALGLCLTLLIVYLINGEAFMGSFPALLLSFSLFDLAGTAMIGGILDLTTVTLYLSVICAFLFFSVFAMEKRRWN